MVTKRVVRNIIGIAVFILSVCSLLFAFTPSHANPADTSTDLNINITPSINLSLTNCAGLPDANSSSITLNVSPTSSGTFKSNCQDVSIQTNTPGYQLLTKTSSTNLTHTTSTATPKPTIPSTTNTFSSPNTIANDTWGYAVANLNNFDTTYTADNASNKYAALTTTDTQIYTTTTFPAPRTDFKFFYGARLSLKTPAGGYKTTITYSAIGDEPGEIVANPFSRVVTENNITTMQNLTSDICTSTDYDSFNNGINDNNTVTLTDIRNNQQYNVRKMADNRCWMITNLKIDGTTVAAVKGDATLTPDDTNIISNWTIPNAGLSTVTYYNQPIIDKDVATPGAKSDQTDINASDFYGYYYNFCAVKAGTNESCTVSGTYPAVSSYDICPAGWRLPTEGYSGGEFATLSSAMVSANNNSAYRNFQFTGPFMGVFSGSRKTSSWIFQGSYGNLRSGSFTTHHADYAFYLNFGPDGVFPENNYDVRSTRWSARCLLQP